MNRSTVSEPVRRKVLREMLVLVGIGVLVGVGTLLAREFVGMKEEIERLSVMAFEPHAGVFVPEIPVETIEGDSVVLGRLGQRQLLFFFNTTCPHCQASLAGWNQVTESLQADSGVTLVGVAFDDAEVAEAYRRAQGLRFKVAPVPDPRVAGLYRINAVPAVVLVNPEGRIAYARLGPMDGQLGIDSILSAVRRIVPVDLEGD